MAQYRKNRLDEELKKAISAILRGMKDQRMQLVSVLSVDVDSDMSSAKVYVSYFGTEDRADVMRSLSRGAGFIRSQLAREFKTRTVPELNFIEDDSIAESFRIGDILNAYNREHPENRENDGTADPNTEGENNEV